MLPALFAITIGLAGILEVSNEPVAIVVDYGSMKNISLKAEDVLLYSYDIPQVKRVEDSQVTYAKRSMAEMMAANVPTELEEGNPTPPNESRFSKRLDHTPPFTGTVVGKVTIVKSAANQRVILISDLQGDGILQVLVKGNTAQTASGEKAKPMVNTPSIMVRNTAPPTDVVFTGATEKETKDVSSGLRSALETHYKGTLPTNLRIVAETVEAK